MIIFNPCSSTGCFVFCLFSFFVSISGHSSMKLFATCLTEIYVFLCLFFNSSAIVFWILQQVQNFGEPFFLVIHEGETLAEVKVRVQKKLQVPDEEFSKVCS